MSKEITKKLGYVIDTNVLCVSSGKANHIEDECIKNAVKFLLEVQQNKSVVYLDEAGEILSEYKNKNTPLGKNGKTGDNFLLYLIQNFGNKNLVNGQIKMRKNQDGDYLDFPADANLRKFHKKDQKFVATARASRKDPQIANAADRKSWENHELHLQKYVKLKFLCKSCSPNSNF
jgi:hypothetical protein